jgi:hypothetical protein
VPSNGRDAEAEVHPSPTCTFADAKSIASASIGNSKGGFTGPERAPSPDGEDVDLEERHQVREGIRQGDAIASVDEGQPQPTLAPSLIRTVATLSVPSPRA